MKRLVLSLLAVLTTISISAAQLVIPAAGAGEGANGSHWQSDLTIHNVGNTPAQITIEFHDGTGLVSEETFAIESRQTISLENIVEDVFGFSTKTGALVITGEEFALRKLSVTSRTFSRSEIGTFGQDIPSMTTSDAATTGDTAVLNGPLDSAATRFNFGLYAAEATQIDWILIRADGTTAATVSETYEPGTHVQYNGGINTFLDSENLPNDALYARIREGRAYIYGSVVENATNDPSFVPSIATRENFAAQLLGVDLNEDGELDIVDADGDGVLDGEVRISTLGYPNFFRIVAIDPEGHELELELVDASSDVRLLDNGTVQWVASGAQQGTAGALKVKASDGFAATEFLIPVLFR
ncbi:MAG: hypothetical protein KY432_05470 [Acidobacteria bacterium]|nr:hypothetical protein [Acidobacteriota bacterium]